MVSLLPHHPLAHFFSNQCRKKQLDVRQNYLLVCDTFLKSTCSSHITEVPFFFLLRVGLCAHVFNRTV